MQEIFEGKIIGEEIISSETPAGAVKNLPYHTRLNPPKKLGQVFKKATKLQTSPFVAKSPQDVLRQHGVYKDESIYKQNPAKIFMDLTQYKDYQTLLNQQNQAKRHFESLDVDIRAKFNHNPVDFANYLASSDFDVKEILTPDEYVSLQRYQAEEEAKEAWNKYIQTDEYKTQKAEEEAYQAYRKAQFDEWKKNRK